jgi:hypothetical protein
MHSEFLKGGSCVKIKHFSHFQNKFECQIYSFNNGILKKVVHPLNPPLTIVTATTGTCYKF